MKKLVVNVVLLAVVQFASTQCCNAMLQRNVSSKCLISFHNSVTAAKTHSDSRHSHLNNQRRRVKQTKRKMKKIEKNKSSHCEPLLSGCLVIVTENKTALPQIYHHFIHNKYALFILFLLFTLHFLCFMRFSFFLFLHFA